MKPVAHTFSHFRALYRPYRFTLAMRGAVNGVRHEESGPDTAWADAPMLESLALAKAQRRIARAVAGEEMEQPGA